MYLRTTIFAAFAAQASAVWLAGVNIAGCDIGMDTSGNYLPQNAYNGQYQCPSLSMAKSQMQHFASKDGFNVFRLPVSWQSLVKNDLVTNKLDPTFFASYNQLVQACLDTSANAHCIIDIHNYARWWGGIIGQDGPNAGIFAQTWSQIASYWASQPRVIFGTMNEPHDDAGKANFNMANWATTLQTVVNAIRAAGAKSQIILLSPSNWANAIDFVNRADALLTVTDPVDSTKANLVFELHQYFDTLGGKTTVCNDTGIAAKFQTTANYLKQHGRKAFIGELGGGNGQDCINMIGGVLDVLNNNGDQFIGWTSWAAGNWWPSYELTEVPGSDGSDVGIVAKAFAPKFKASQGETSG